MTRGDNKSLPLLCGCLEMMTELFCGYYCRADGAVGNRKKGVTDVKSDNISDEPSIPQK